MSFSSSPRLEPVPASKDPRRELLERVAAGASLQKSNRLRELLEYLGDRTLSNPDTPIREQEIGVAVFGRSVNYDTSQDTLVRVQASQLRKKLQQHFAEDGHEEPFIIEIPKGSYSLSFHSREALDPPTAIPAGPSAFQRWLPWSAVAALVCLSIVLLFQNSALRRRTELGTGPKPSVDRFWREMFGNGRQTSLALADANLVVFEDAMKQQMSLGDYQRKDFNRLAQDRIENPVARAMALSVINRPYTSMADAGLVRRMSLVFATNELPMEILLSRDLTLAQASAQNTILVGSRRANPWVSLYEDTLNFQTVFEETPRAAWLRNRNPKPGEPPEYRGQWSKIGYCRVAYLGNTKKTGSVLLISGTDVPSTEAGGEFITGEASIHNLRQLLEVKDGAPMPHFEVLLEAMLVSNAVAKHKIVAWRRY